MGAVRRFKVTVVGAGNVGATTAQRLADAELADVVLIDIVDGIPQGKGLDMLEACPVTGSDVHVSGTTDYADTAGSDIVVITAGLPRKAGMSRDDLLRKNYQIVKQVTESAVAVSPDAILVVVSNPLDAMVQTALRASGFARQRVVGMAGILDSARMRAFIARELDVSVENVHASVLGGHGDDMVPLPRYSTVAGIPLPEVLDDEAIARIVERTRKGGGEIVAYLKTGSAYYAPSAAIVEMVDAILKDKKKILPCAAYLEGEYGLDGIYLGVPVKLGRGGVEEVVEIHLTDDEKAALDRSAASVRELIGVIGV